MSSSAPDPNIDHRLADGSFISNNGEKSLLGMTAEGTARRLKAQVTDVDRPLMSVSQVVENGGRVVFDKKGSYIEGGGQRIAIEREGKLFKLTMWVPREQEQTVSQLSRSFHGQA